MLAGGDEGLGRRLAIDEVLPGGRRLATAIRALQADGHGVAVVSKRSGSALVQADLGIGVLDRVRPDAVGRGRDHRARRGPSAPELPGAGEEGGRAVRMAQRGGNGPRNHADDRRGPQATAVDRASLVSDCTTLAAIGMGEWAARNIGRGTLPVPADRTPWHAMSARKCPLLA